MKSILTVSLFFLCLSVQAQECDDARLKKIMNSIPNSGKVEEEYKRKADLKVAQLAKIKNWNEKQAAEYSLSVVLDKNNFSKGEDPMANMNKMMAAISKKDCATLENMAKNSDAAAKKQWEAIYKRIDDDISKAKPKQ